MYRRIHIRQVIFQYISCCSLSYQFQRCKILPMLFQYISCCSLSGLLKIEGWARDGYFNTSHVVVYPIYYFAQKANFTYFNTSHVVVYRSSSRRAFAAFPYFNTSHVVVYLTHFRAFYFFISLFALISRHFSDFYQAPRLYYFQCLVLHKSLVFTILFHFSQLSRLVNFLQISFSFLYH